MGWYFMYQKLVSHNDDIRGLVEKGYAVSFDSNYLVIRDIPYLDNESNLQKGAFVTKLEFINENKVAQQDHQVFFAGGIPHQLDKSPIPNLGGGPTSLALSDKCSDIVVQRSFSNKPKVDGALVGFPDFFAKIESYTSIVSGPAIDLYGISPYTFNTDSSEDGNSVFRLHDTLTSRAEITDLSRRFENETVVIIGLGGTGAYLLDFLVKTPVKEIRAFDPDSFCVHNAYRSPGKLDLNDLGKTKAEIYKNRYENFRKGIDIRPEFINQDSGKLLDGATFAFVCVDKGSARKEIFELLIGLGIPYIDVGMGLKRKNELLTGLIRTTYFPPDRARELTDKGLAELNDGPENIYRTNIQIGELNAFNASLAIIRYKQLKGFYKEESSNITHVFNIVNLETTGDNCNECD